MSKRTETTMSELFAIVYRNYLDNDRASTYIVHLHIKNQLDPALGKLSAERITGAVIEAYKDKRLNQDGAARATINLELSTIRRGMKLGLERGLHSNRLVVKLYPIGNSNRRTGFFEQSEYEAMVKECNQDQADMLIFAYGSGWRQGDIIPLQWDINYDADANVIRIFKSKNGKGRTLPLNAAPELHDLIQRRWQLRGKNCPYIFHYHGRRYNAKTFNRHWLEAKRAAGIDRNFHDTRRTVVRNLTRAGVHRAIARAITGHQTDAVFDRYDIVDERDISGGLEKLSNYTINQQRDKEKRPSDDTTPHSNLVLTLANNSTITGVGSDEEYTSAGCDTIVDVMTHHNPIISKEKLAAIDADARLMGHFESRLAKFLNATRDALKGRK